jgi:hypothetical protein
MTGGLSPPVVPVFQQFLPQRHKDNKNSFTIKHFDESGLTTNPPYLS